MTLLEEIKIVLRVNVSGAPYGIYGEHRSSRKGPERLFERAGVIVNIYRSTGCFEVLGLTDEQFDEIRKYYNEIHKPVTATEGLHK